MKRLNVIEEKLAELDYAKAPGFLINGLKREQPVMAKLIEGGLQITAVHNHLLRASPATFYMHVGGHGDPAKMANVIRDALSVSKTPLSAPPAATAQPSVDLNTAQLDQTIGAKGQANGGVYQFGVPRREPVSESGMPIAPAGPMGLATGINFQPTAAVKRLLQVTLSWPATR